MPQRNPQRQSAKKKITIFDLKRSHHSSHPYQSKTQIDSSNGFISKYKPSPGVQQFYQQVSLNREYLEKLDNTVEKICEKEKYRNYLNEKYYGKILLKAEQAHSEVIQQIQKFKSKEKQHILQGFEGVIEDIKKLEKLKKGFIEAYKKLDTQLQQEEKKLKQAVQKNEQLKNTIKNNWKEMEINGNREKLTALNQQQSHLNQMTLNNSLVTEPKEQQNGLKPMGDITNVSCTQTEREKSINKQIGKKFKNKDMLKYKYHLPINRQNDQSFDSAQCGKQGGNQNILSKVKTVSKENIKYNKSNFLTETEEKFHQGQKAEKENKNECILPQIFNSSPSSPLVNQGNSNLHSSILKSHRNPKKFENYLNSKWIKDSSRKFNEEIEQAIKLSMNTQINEKGVLSFPCLENSLHKNRSFLEKNLLSHSQNSCFNEKNLESLQKYNQAVDRVLQIEKNINKKNMNKSQSPNLGGSKSKEKNNYSTNNITNLKSRVVKVKQKIEKEEYYVVILKLLVTYLSKFELKKQIFNKSGCENLTKVLCFLRKVIQSKEDLLSQVKSILEGITL